MKKKTSCNLKYSVGIDIGKKTFHVCLSVIDSDQRVTIKGSRQFENRALEFEHFLEWVVRLQKEDLPLSYVMEATGVYHENLCHFLYKSGFSVSVIVPTMSKRYAQSLGTDNKTDKVDAKVLSRMGAERALDSWQPFSPSIISLRGLCRHHESLQETKTAMSNQVHALVSGAYAYDLQKGNLLALLELIEKQLEEVDKAIEKAVKEDELLNNKWKKCKGIHGIGLLSFATIIAETNGFSLFYNERQLVSYAGYDVIQNQSGNHNGKTKISKKGNKHLRRILYMPALSAINAEDSIFANLYNRVFERTKIKMKGYVAVQRKLLTTIFHLCRKDVVYDSQYHRKTSGNPESIAPFPYPMCDEKNKKKAPEYSGAELDKLPYKPVIESPLSVMQS